mmetsp:Transcript_56885/g.123662  ORF Transcript_56885/g.123662 Transcript_56885/m.123662 type:complete len:303 (+) Transcript_56885:124-1032(+)
MPRVCPRNWSSATAMAVGRAVPSTRCHFSAASSYATPHKVGAAAVSLTAHNSTGSRTRRFPTQPTTTPTEQTPGCLHVTTSPGAKRVCCEAAGAADTAAWRAWRILSGRRSAAVGMMAPPTSVTRGGMASQGSALATSTTAPDRAIASSGATPSCTRRAAEGRTTSRSPGTTPHGASPNAVGRDMAPSECADVGAFGGGHGSGRGVRAWRGVEVDDCATLWSHCTWQLSPSTPVTSPSAPTNDAAELALDATRSPTRTARRKMACAVAWAEAATTTRHLPASPEVETSMTMTEWAAGPPGWL